ncbi:MAG: hypothetical protein M1142_00800 [Patescibacteria group bacterium]|nr:hypothetical protein [Patescibacteria group bacterium]
MNEAKLKEFYFRYKFIILPVVVGFCSITVIILVVIPQFMSYFKVQKEIGDLRTRTGVLESKAKDLESVDPADTQQKLQIALTVLPTDQDVLTTVDVLHNLIIKEGLSVQNTDYSLSRQTSGRGNFRIGVTVSGPLASVRNLLIDLQNSSQVFQVESINTTFRPGGIVDVELPLSVYYENTPSQLGNIDQPVPKLTDKDKQLLQDLAAAVDRANQMALSLVPATSSAVPLGKIDPFE